MENSISREILGMLYNAHRFLSRLESEPRDYGTEDILYSTDIHTVLGIHAVPGCNLTRLADKLDVSKAAVSKFTAKMERLGYIRKEHSAENGKMVLFTLTKKGKKAVRAHEAFEKKMFGPLTMEIEKLKPGERKTVAAFLQNMHRMTRELEKKYLD
jgi:DNA-binding MarR family transcriptional regulator